MIVLRFPSPLRPRATTYLEHVGRPNIVGLPNPNFVFFHTMDLLEFVKKLCLTVFSSIFFYVVEIENVVLPTIGNF